MTFFIKKNFLTNFINWNSMTFDVGILGEVVLKKKTEKLITVP